MSQNKNICGHTQTQTPIKVEICAQGQNQSRRLITGEIQKISSKRGCPPNKQILGKDFSIEPKKPQQKILQFKSHFAGNSDPNTAIPANNKINVTKLINPNQYDLYHQVSQSQRAKIFRTNNLARRTELARPKANSRHQNPAQKKFETKLYNVRSYEASPMNNKINRDIVNCQQNNQRIVTN